MRHFPEVREFEKLGAAIGRDVERDIFGSPPPPRQDFELEAPPSGLD